jgi:exonuclease VII small subunit
MSSLFFAHQGVGDDEDPDAQQDQQHHPEPEHLSIWRHQANRDIVARQNINHINADFLLRRMLRRSTTCCCAIMALSIGNCPDDQTNEDNMKTYLERALEQHGKLVHDLDTASVQRDKAIRLLLRAVAKHDRTAKALARSQRRIDKAREEEKAARAARKAAKAEPQSPIIV